MKTTDGAVQVATGEGVAQTVSFSVEKLAAYATRLARLEGRRLLVYLRPLAQKCHAEVDLDKYEIAQLILLVASALSISLGDKISLGNAVVELTTVTVPGHLLEEVIEAIETECKGIGMEFKRAR